MATWAFKVFADMANDDAQIPLRLIAEAKSLLREYRVEV